MTTRTQHTTKAKPTASRWVRFAVWAMFALVLTTGVSSMSADVSGATFGPRPGEAAGLTAQPGGVSSTLTSLCSRGDNCRANYSENPHEVLPAWRWRSDLDLHSHSKGGITDLGAGLREGMTLFANIGFAISNMVWSLTLNLVKFATTIDYLGAVGARINQGFAALSESLIGVIGIIWLFVMLRAGKLSAKGDLVGMFRAIGMFILPIAFLFYFHTQAAADSTGLSNDFSEVGTTAGRAGNVKGSPVWLAHEVTDKMNMAVDGVTGGITLFGSADSDVLKFPGHSNGWPACDAYIENLYAQYDAVGATGATSSALEQVSKFWAVTTYGPWMDAQFGDYANRGKVSCQLLEERAGIPVPERRALFASMEGAPATQPSESTLENGHGERVALLRQKHGAGGLSNTVKRDRALAFAACYYEAGTWKVDWRWIAVGDPSIGKQDGRDDAAQRAAHAGKNGTASGWCSTWWEHGYAVEDDPSDPAKAYDTPEIPGQGHLKIALGEVDDIGHGTSLNGVESREAGAFMGDFYGSNGVTRMMLGFIALISSFVYLFVLGGVSFGALLAQFGLVLLLIFLPISLIGLAAGADFGRRMTKLTIALCGSKLMFALLLSVMTQLTLLGLVLFSKVGGITAAGEAVQGGIQNSVASAMVPLLVLFIVNRALSSMGIAKLTSAGGAMSAVGKLAGQASGGTGSVGGFLAKPAQGGSGKLSNSLKSGMRAGGDLAKDKAGKAGGAALSKVPGGSKLRHRAERKDVSKAERGFERWSNSAEVREKRALAAAGDEDARKWLGEREKSFGKEIGSKQAKLSRLEATDEDRWDQMKRFSTLGVAGALSRARKSVDADKTNLNALPAAHFADDLDVHALAQSTDAEFGSAALEDRARAVARSGLGSRAAAAEVGAVIGDAEVAMIGSTAELRPDQLEAVVATQAAALHVDPSNLIATSGGAVVPDVINLDAEARVRIAQTEWASALLLPDDVTAVRELADGVVEAAEDRARRIIGAMSSVGALTVDSQKIHIAAPEIVLDSHGVDLGTAAGQQLWRDFANGVESAVASMPSIEAPVGGSPAQLMWDSVVHTAGPDSAALVAAAAQISRQVQQDCDDMLATVEATSRSLSNDVASSLQGIQSALDAGGMARTNGLDQLDAVRSDATAQLEELIRNTLTVDASARAGGAGVDVATLTAEIEMAVKAARNQLMVFETKPAEMAAHLEKITRGFAQRAEEAGRQLSGMVSESAREIEAAAQAAARSGPAAPKALPRFPRDPRGGI